MAKKLIYGSPEQQKECVKASITTSHGDVYEVEAYESCYFDSVPQGKTQYYCRHSEDNWCIPVSVRNSLGLMVNCWGCIVVDGSIDFHDNNEIDIDYDIIEDEE